MPSDYMQIFLLFKVANPATLVW